MWSTSDEQSEMMILQWYVFLRSRLTKMILEGALVMDSIFPLHSWVPLYRVSDFGLAFVSEPLGCRTLSRRVVA